jgi:hypothetical protein
MTGQIKCPVLVAGRFSSQEVLNANKCGAL